MAADLELEGLAAQADRAAIEARRQQQRLLFVRRRAVAKSSTIDAYRRLFLDAAGNPRPEAVAVIADISTVAQLGRFDPAGVTDAEMRERNGKRALALHILSQLDLDGSRLRQLARTMREAGNE